MHWWITQGSLQTGERFAGRLSHLFNDGWNRSVIVLPRVSSKGEAFGQLTLRTNPKNSRELRARNVNPRESSDPRITKSGDFKNPYSAQIFERSHWRWCPLRILRLCLDNDDNCRHHHNFSESRISSSSNHKLQGLPPTDEPFSTLPPSAQISEIASTYISETLISTWIQSRDAIGDKGHEPISDIDRFDQCDPRQTLSTTSQIASGGTRESGIRLQRIRYQSYVNTIL